MCQKASHRTLAVSSPCLGACTVVSVGCSAVWKTGAPALSARTIFSRNCASRVGHWASTRQTRLRRAGPATGTGTRLSTLVRRLWPLGVDCRMLTSWLQMSQKKTRLPETVWKFWCFTDTRNLSLLTFCWDLCVGPVPLRYCCFYTTRWCKPSFCDGVLTTTWHGTAGNYWTADHPHLNCIWDLRLAAPASSEYKQGSWTSGGYTTNSFFTRF